MDRKHGSFYSLHLNYGVNDFLYHSKAGVGDGISASVMVLTMAIVEPMIRQAGFDMIWFGIFLVVVVEMAQITPPVGFNLFVLQGMANKDMGYIAKALSHFFINDNSHNDNYFFPGNSLMAS